MLHEHSDAILPAGISLLDEVFTEILAEKGLPRDCEAAEVIARRLFLIFQSGMRDRDMLRTIAVGAISSPDTPSPSRGSVPAGRRLPRAPSAA